MADNPLWVDVILPCLKGEREQVLAEFLDATTIEEFSFLKGRLFQTEALIEAPENYQRAKKQHAQMLAKKLEEDENGPGGNDRKQRLRDFIHGTR